jgi:hypothetical protein
MRPRPWLLCILLVALIGAGNTPSTKPSSATPRKYQPSTPQKDAAAIDAARKTSGEVQHELHLQLRELQTPHFIVFTDWDLSEEQFLRTNLEGAYGAVSRQFDIPAKQNVFVGKLPVFMFARRVDFEHYAEKFDDLPPNNQILGYYAGNGTGSGHMAMWKPSISGGEAQRAAAERQWAYTLTHEFTHAFVDRYQTSRRIPRWLNEGIAEVIAQSQFPQQNRRVYARQVASEARPIDIVFDDDQMPGGEWYPVMQTLVETLVAQDHSRFLTYFDAIKAGENPQKALQRIYGWTYEDLVKQWRTYVMR